MQKISFPLIVMHAKVILHALPAKISKTRIRQQIWYPLYVNRDHNLHIYLLPAPGVSTRKNKTKITNY